MKVNAFIKALTYTGGVIVLVALLTMCSVDFSEIGGKRSAGSTSAIPPVSGTEQELRFLQS